MLFFGYMIAGSFHGDPPGDLLLVEDPAETDGFLFGEGDAAFFA